MKLFFVFIAFSVLCGIAVLGVIISVSYDLPQLNSLSDYSPPIPSRILSKNGHLLLELSREKRELATIDEIPKKVIAAFLAAEDDNFYNHSGIDYLGIARAMLKNIKEGRIKQGASTITQQVAKSLLLSNERTFTRKIKDMILAKKIEEKLSKDEILFLYLNQVYLGGGYYGVKAAFRGYFDKELTEATIAETALVAGLLVAPGRYSPYINPKRAKSRQRYVLGRLYKTSKISKVDYDAALAEDIKIQLRQPSPFRAGYFTEWIRQRMIAHFGKEEFLTNGYEVVTTIDWELQEKAEKEVLKGVKALDKRQGYKGPLEHIEADQDRINFLTKQRNEVYKKSSRFIIFKTDGTSNREFQAEEDELTAILENETEYLSETTLKGKVYLEPGVTDGDRLIEYLNFSKPVKALVTKVSNSQRVIYASYAGVKIIIPNDKFKWAHERAISEEVKYWGFQNYPESIVKEGDVILVSIENKQVNAWKYIFKKFKTKIKDNEELITALKSQKFYLAQLDQEPEAQGALLSISPISGEIVAMVGGTNFRKSQFNRVVQSNRQPGSAFKPLIFAVGLENHYTPASSLLDTPQALGGVDESLSWKPRNYDGKFKGTMTFRRALETSRNIPTIKLTQDIGVKKIAEFIERLDIKVKLPQDLSVSLGSFGVNLLGLVKMYTIFPNGGKKVNIKSVISVTDRYGNLHHLSENGKKAEEVPIESGDEEIINAPDMEIVEKEIDPNIEKNVMLDENGEPIKKNKKKQNPYKANLNDEQVYDQRLAYIMSNILKGVIQRGTGRNTSDISSFIGGKTGTTNNYIDAWFLGFSSKLVTGVWTGFDNNKTLGWPETGAKAALPIWKEFMKLGIRKFGESDFPIPSGIVNVAIDPETGKLASEDSARFVESFVDGSEPGLEVSSDDVEENSDISILDSEDYYSNQ